MAFQKINQGGRWHSTKKYTEQSAAPPLGELIVRIKAEDLQIKDGYRKTRCAIDQVAYVSSYNWVHHRVPKILVPGKPPLWAPPAEERRLEEDSGIFYHDQNSASFPTHPMEPAVVAVMEEAIAPLPLDMFACNETLFNLIQFLSGSVCTFRMLVELVDRTVHLVRRENTPKEQIHGIRGYGHAFPRACSFWEKDVEGSYSHQRILKYSFDGLRLIVRFKIVGYIDDQKLARMAIEDRVASTQDPQNCLQELELSSSPTDKLLVEKCGERIDTSKILVVKTRQSSAKKMDILHDQLPKLWLVRAPLLIVALHEEGKFVEVHHEQVARHVQLWESLNQSLLRQLGVLLRRISATARTRSDVKLELVRTNDGPLELRERLADAGNPFSVGVRETWEAWLRRGRLDAAEPSTNRGQDGAGDSSAPIDDSQRTGKEQDHGKLRKSLDYDSDFNSDSEDFTACDTGCGYCGRCSRWILL